MSGRRGVARATLLTIAGMGAMLALVATASASLVAPGTPGASGENHGSLTSSSHCAYRVSLYATPQFTMVGSLVTLTTHVVVVGGPYLQCLGGLSYQYFGLPSGIVSANLPVIHGSPMSQGNFHVTVVVHLGAGGYLVSSVMLSVGAPA